MSQFLTYLPQFEGILPKWLVFVSLTPHTISQLQTPAKLLWCLEPAELTPLIGLRRVRP
jgi:hypothetical protein